MSIMPPDGWEVRHQDNTEQQPVVVGDPYRHSRYRRTSGLTCKVCDSGILATKSLFRMSGPAVVIGFILLVPSVCGMVFSVLMLFGVIAATAVAPSSQHRTQSSFDADFRRSCATSFSKSYQDTGGVPPSKVLTERYCECALSEFKQSGSMSVAAQTCVDRAADGTLGTVGRDVDQLYLGSSSSVSTDEETGPFRMLIGVIGGISAIAMLIVSFVGGLLGWLLVMKKRVLQCDVCGAIVNAS